MTNSRKFALDNNLPRYEGAACPRGHTTRWTADHKCVQCRLLREKNKRAPGVADRKARIAAEAPLRKVRQRERVRQYGLRVRADPEKLALIKERARRYYLAHREERLAYKRAYMKRMSLEQKRRYHRSEYHRNPEPYIRRAQLREGKMKKDQRCKCCTNKQLAAVYRFAKMLGCEVDHRVPLAVGGMHCVENLQCLTEEEHAAKTENDRKTYGWIWS